MKNILVTSLPTYPIIKNIGDYILVVATKQFVKHLDGYVDREKSNIYECDTKCKAVFNGTFLWEYKNWPPSDCIEPLFTSMHVFPFVVEKFFTDENIKYFQEHSPIGCRDLGTLKVMQQYNIPSYYSACLTLTLGKTYKQNVKNNKLLFVDPIIPIDLIRKNPINWRFKDIKTIYQVVHSTVLHPIATMKLCQKQFFRMYGNQWGHRETTGFKNLVETLFFVSAFIGIYSTKFDIKSILEADFISNMYYLKEGENNNVSLMNVAEEYIKRYTEYPLIVTSRIHCALPCIGIGIPVVFILNKIMEDQSVKFNTPGRFDGMTDFFRIMRIEENKIMTKDEVLSHIDKIDNLTRFNNKENWKPYAEKLAKQVSDFFNN